MMVLVKQVGAKYQICPNYTRPELRRTFLPLHRRETSLVFPANPAQIFPSNTGKLSQLRLPKMAPILLNKNDPDTPTSFISLLSVGSVPLFGGAQGRGNSTETRVGRGRERRLIAIYRGQLLT